MQRLKDNGNLLLDELIETGHKPLHMDFTIWEDGQTGSIGPFVQWSSGNSRILADDPWGKETVVWMTAESTDPTYPSQGGIYYSTAYAYSTIDNTKMYRLSWWEKRVTNGTATYARYYAGLNSYGNALGIKFRGATTTTTNPYFWYSLNLPGADLRVGSWVLIVGHVWPYGSGEGANHPDSGRYTIAEGKYATITRDYTFLEGADRLRSRTLAIYRGDTDDVVHYTAYPRMDVCDGTEPTIKQLLNGFDSQYIDYIRSVGGGNDICMGIKQDKTYFAFVFEDGSLPANTMMRLKPGLASVKGEFQEN